MRRRHELQHDLGGRAEYLGQTPLISAADRHQQAPPAKRRRWLSLECRAVAEIPSSSSSAAKRVQALHVPTKIMHERTP